MYSLMMLLALAAAQKPSYDPGPPVTEESRSSFTLDPGTEAEKGPALREDAVLRWNRVTLDLIRAERTPPPQVTRTLAMVHVAVCDSVLSINRTHRPFRFEIDLRESADPTAAASSAAYRVLLEIYPRQRRTLERALDESLGKLPDGPEQRRGIDLGRRVAEKVLLWRRDDGSLRRASGKGGEEIGVWRPTLPRFAPGLLPQWADLRPFGVSDPRALRPDPPPALTSLEYTRDFNEVRKLGGLKSRDRTAEQTCIAFFWADDIGSATPPGHWNEIAQTVSRQEGHSLTDNARLFALLNLALADAAVVCWDCKYHYRLWRPITAIHEADLDKNPDTHPEADWEPLLDTPPFPTYTSGHSTFSGAAARVLAIFHRSDSSNFEVSSDGWTEKRSFRSFSAAAQEAGRSRIYGGIHFEFDNRAGLSAGRKVAEEICRTHLLPEVPGSTKEK